MAKKSSSHTIPTKKAQIITLSGSEDKIIETIKKTLGITFEKGALFSPKEQDIAPDYEKKITTELEITKKIKTALKKYKTIMEEMNRNLDFLVIRSKEISPYYFEETLESERLYFKLEAEYQKIISYINSFENFSNKKFYINLTNENSFQYFIYKSEHYYNLFKRDGKVEDISTATLAAEKALEITKNFLLLSRTTISANYQSEVIGLIYICICITKIYSDLYVSKANTHFERSESEQIRAHLQTIIKAFEQNPLCIESYSFYKVISQKYLEQKKFSDLRKIIQRITNSIQQDNSLDALLINVTLVLDDLHIYTEELIDLVNDNFPSQKTQGKINSISEKNKKIQQLTNTINESSQKIKKEIYNDILKLLYSSLLFNIEKLSKILEPKNLMQESLYSKLKPIFISLFKFIEDDILSKMSNELKNSTKLILDKEKVTFNESYKKIKNPIMDKINRYDNEQKTIDEFNKKYHKGRTLRISPSDLQVIPYIVETTFRAVFNTFKKAGQESDNTNKKNTVKEKFEMLIPDKERKFQSKFKKYNKRIYRYKSSLSETYIRSREYEDIYDINRPTYFLKPKEEFFSCKTMYWEEVQIFLKKIDEKLAPIIKTTCKFDANKVRSSSLDDWNFIDRSFSIKQKTTNSQSI